MPSPTTRSTAEPRPATDDPAGLFVYGTLRLAPVLEALLGRIPARTPSAVHGWRAAALDGRIYPGLVPAAGGTAAGQLLTDLSALEHAVLDAFEGEEYRRTVLALASGEPAWAYLWTGGDIRADNWDIDLFTARHLPAYAARCARIAPGLTALATGRGRP
ncbi:gamma-glutamylcyclotransferase family protein [Streptomyces sp. NBRC 109706]|uniref:gamma-glutamylcyclotransferase family protein n=1 Tax=Streptomyces sp. NBRC 109706 TaxID=1550035 RepID=UPI00078244CE|nr:gamma-glutamylcyclotransferase family protein [Streptomyces sp. NBRC 109706]